MSKGTKRQRREESEEEEETQHVALPDGLRALMGGRKFCPQEELTREVLLKHLKAKGGIREVDGLLDIHRSDNDRQELRRGAGVCRWSVVVRRLVC